jgi:hypothetical protein
VPARLDTVEPAAGSPQFLLQTDGCNFGGAIRVASPSGRFGLSTATYLLQSGRAGSGHELVVR